MLDHVERRSLGGQQRAGIAGKPHQVRARGRPAAFLDQDLDPGIRVEHPENRLRDRKPGDDDRLAAIHHPHETRVGGDDGGGADIAPLAHILGKRLGDEAAEIEAVELPVLRRHSLSVPLSAPWHKFRDSDSGRCRDRPRIGHQRAFAGVKARSSRGK